ncbi:MAG: PAS domain S-box protein, partial [Nitrospina sp.]|nr:PAS domain S-box protein [Nitrospina sp.]
DLSEHSIDQLTTMLRQEELLVTSVLSNALDSIIVIDEWGIVSTFNPGAEKMFGYQPSEMIGQSINLLVPEPDRSKHNEYLQKYLSTGKRNILGMNRELTGQHKNGSVFPMDLGVNEMKLENGDGSYSQMFIGTCRNIAHRKMVDAQLKRETDIVALLKKIGDEANKDLPANKILQYALEQVCALTGWPIGHVYFPSMNRADFMETSKIWYLKDPSKFKEFKDVTDRTSFKIGVGLPGRVLKSRKAEWIVNVQEDQNFPRNKLAKNILVKGGFAFPILTQSKVAGVLEFFSEDNFSPDTTERDQKFLEAVAQIGIQLGRVLERQKTQEELLKAKDIAESANQAKSEFLSRMSHELRTPMNAILGFTEVLEMDRDKTLSDRQKDNLGQVSSAGKHLLELINEVLDLARIESGDMELVLETVDMVSIVDDVLSIAQPLTDETGISLECQVVPEGRFFVEVDPLRLKQVILNLLSNAIKYNDPNGSVVVSYKKQDDGKIRLGVRDTGHGIPDKKRDKLFKPFERLDAHSELIEGTGIGLSISKQLIELMGGTIGFESTFDKGSFFYIDIPLSDKKPLTLETKPALDSVPASLTGTHEKTVLYIDDIPANILLVQDILSEQQQIKLLSTSNALDGIKVARTEIPDLILMDIHMPDVDGLTAFKKLQGIKETQNIPVIALTADAMKKDAKKALDMGFHSYITKPINIQKFIEAIDKVLT